MPTSTPWGYFSENVGHADSALEWLALVVVTLILLHLYVGRWQLVILLALGVVAVVKPEVRDSRLVRIGAAVLLVTFGFLSFAGTFVTDNPLGAGMLFAFSSPIALLLIFIGMIQSFVRSDKGMNEDVAALAAAAKRTGRVWPDDAPLRHVDDVVKHGSRAGPALVALLRFESEEQLRDESWSAYVEQQAELALCRIYGEPPAAGRTVYDIRATSAENIHVKEFWEAKVRP